MTNNFNPGDLATVIAGKGGPNNVRAAPIWVPDCGNCISSIAEHTSIPEHAVLAILPAPDDWTETYPKNDGVYVWWYVRGRTAVQQPDGRFEVIEGWSAASKTGEDYLSPMSTNSACRDTMGTQFHTALVIGQEVYVLPPDGLNIRKEADPHAGLIKGLAQGTVVTIAGGPVCGNKMIWWQVKLAGSSKPAGWVSEGDGVEQFLAPLTLEY